MSDGAVIGPEVGQQFETGHVSKAELGVSKGTDVNQRTGGDDHVANGTIGVGVRRKFLLGGEMGAVGFGDLGTGQAVMVRLGTWVRRSDEGSASDGEESWSREAQGEMAGDPIATVGVDGEQVGIDLCLGYSDGHVVRLGGDGAEGRQRLVWEKSDNGGDIVGHRLEFLGTLAALFLS